MGRRRAELLAAGALAGIAGAICWIGEGADALRVLFALPLVFLLPGYAITRALFPSRRLDWVTIALLVLGTSLSVVVASTSAIAAAGVRLEARSVAVTLAGIALVALLVASLRSGASDDSKLALGRPFAARNRLRLWAPAVVFAAVAVAIVLQSALIATEPLPSTDAVGYTTLWLVPEDGHDGTFSIGVESSELTLVSYELQVIASGVPVLLQPLRLAPTQRWEATVTVPGEIRPSAVTALLYRLDAQASVYRRAHVPRADAVIR